MLAVKRIKVDRGGEIHLRDPSKHIINPTELKNLPRGLGKKGMLYLITGASQRQRDLTLGSQEDSGLANGPGESLSDQTEQICFPIIIQSHHAIKNTKTSGLFVRYNEVPEEIP